jgi:hypothetical protein
VAVSVRPKAEPVSVREETSLEVVLRVLVQISKKVDARVLVQTLEKAGTPP